MQYDIGGFNTKVGILKKVCLVATSLLCCVLTNGQETRKDSLKDIWNDTMRHDTVRFNAMTSFINEYYIKDVDSTLVYLQLQYDFSQKNNLQKQEADALKEIGNAYYRKRDYKSTLEYYKKSLGVIEGLKDKKQKITLLNNIGGVHYSLADYKEALVHFRESLELNEELGDQKGLSYVYNFMGITLSAQGSYTEALEQLSKGMRIAEEIDDKPRIAIGLNNIGNIYKHQKNYPKALEYHTKSLTIKQLVDTEAPKEEIDNKLTLAVAFKNLGDDHYFLTDYPKALENYNKCLAISEKWDYTSGVIFAMIGIGNVKNKLGDQEDALMYYRDCLALSREKGEKAQVTNILNLMGQVYLDRQDYAKAIDHGAESLKIAEEIGKTEDIAGSSNILYQAYKAQDKLAQSLAMHELYIKMRDSLTNNRFKEELIKQEYDDKFAKEKFENDLIYKQKEELFYAVLIFLVIMILIISFNYQRKQKINKRLELKEVQLNDLNVKLKLFNKVVAHDLKSPMVSFKVLIDKLVTKYHQTFSPKDLLLLNMANQKINYLNLLVNDLLLFYSLGNKNLELENSSIDFGELIKRINHDISSNLPDLIDIETAGLPTLNLNENLVRQLFTNLLSNSVKYAKTDVPVKISITSEKATTDGHYKFCVEDNGIGVPDGFKPIAFDLFSRVAKSNNLGHGLGLPICRNIVEYYNGDIWIEDNQYGGTSIHFTLQPS